MSVYTVKKGFHRCFPIRVGIYLKRQFMWSARFNKSMIYDIGSDQSDVNKVCGVFFPFGGMIKINGSWHWKYSARFGVRWYEGNLEMMAYVHDREVISKNQKICNVNFDQDIPLILFMEQDIAGGHLQYYFQVGEGFYTSLGTSFVPRTHKLKLSCPTNFYFGGNRAATHDTTVSVTKKYINV